jgi:hypothetical protein
MAGWLVAKLIRHFLIHLWVLSRTNPTEIFLLIAANLVQEGSLSLSPTGNLPTRQPSLRIVGWMHFTIFGPNY